VSDEKPGLGKRAAYFVLGAIVGGLVGYGFAGGGQEVAPSIFDAAAAPWVFGLAAICGALGAYSPGKFLDRSRYR
jgi:hypothetical protein